MHKDSLLGDIHNRGMVQVIYKLVDSKKEGFTEKYIDQYSSYCSKFIQESVSKRQQLLVSSCLPIRCKAVHYCTNNPLMRKIFSLAQCSSTTADRLRIRNHFGKFRAIFLVYVLFLLHIPASIDSSILSRTRMLGTHKEVQKELLKYGLSSSHGLPIDEDGTIETSRHLEYLELLKTKDRLSSSKQQGTSTVHDFSVAAGPSSSNYGFGAAKDPPSQGKSDGHNVGIGGGNSAISPTFIQDVDATSDNGDESNAQEKRILKPGPNDVLLGRGKQYQDHSGNVQLVQMVERYRRRYHASTSNIEKTCINQLIVQMIHEKNGRFLERDKSSALAAKTNTPEMNKKNKKGTDNKNVSNDESVWVEVSNDKAWAKVSRYFRQW